VRDHIIPYFEKQNSRTITMIGIVLACGLGAIDLATGYEISFSIFYLAPIALVTWWAGRRSGLAIAVLSALLWLAADVASGHVFTDPLVPLWNALMRLGFFLIVVTLMSRLKRSYEEQVRVARELRESLDKIRTLSGLIPICAWCKKVRNEQGYWQQVEAYISENSDASFTHGMCAECREKERQALRQRAT
jgi:K+-sensing histidine kinase KdpD